MTKRWQISRRTLLRGAGASLALPLLDAMSPLTALAASGNSEAPLRGVFVCAQRRRDERLDAGENR